MERVIWGCEGLPEDGDRGRGDARGSPRMETEQCRDVRGLPEDGESNLVMQGTPWRWGGGLG